MIQPQDMLPMLVRACPSFAQRWTEGNKDSFLDVDGNLLHYVALGSLAAHLVQLAAARTFQEFRAVFAVVEQLHVEGDRYVREAATVGLLEGIQNHAGHEGLDPTVFLPWLGPESRKWWDKLEDFWNGNLSALEE